MVDMTQVDTTTELFKEALATVADILATDLGNRYANKEELIQGIEFVTLKIIVEEANKQNSDTFENVLLKCKVNREEKIKLIIEYISNYHLKRFVCENIANLEYNYELIKQPNYLKKEDLEYIPSNNSSHK